MKKPMKKIKDYWQNLALTAKPYPELKNDPRYIELLNKMNPPLMAE
jgi:hypothetical protein